MSSSDPKPRGTSAVGDGVDAWELAGQTGSAGGSVRCATKAGAAGTAAAENGGARGEWQDADAAGMSRRRAAATLRLGRCTKPSSAASPARLLRARATRKTWRDEVTAARAGLCGLRTTARALDAALDRRHFDAHAPATAPRDYRVRGYAIVRTDPVVDGTQTSARCVTAGERERQGLSFRTRRSLRSARPSSCDGSDEASARWPIDPREVVE